MIPKHFTLRRLPLLTLIAWVGPVCWPQQPTPQEDVLMRLKAAPGDSALLREAKSAGKTLEAKAILKEELLKRCQRLASTLSFVECGGTASALQSLDTSDKTGEDTLVAWIDTFLAKRIPPAIDREPIGREEQFTSEYKEWSRKQGWLPGETLTLETGCGMLIRDLGFMGDPKLRPLFRRALESNSYAIISAATFGLALLGDKEALPSILAAAERLKPGGAIVYQMVLSELRNYDDHEVDRLIQMRVTDKVMRDYIMQTKPMPIRPEFRQQR